MWIDTTYDFRTDANGKDPDSSSITLKQYQQFLWSKPLPNGGELILDEQLHNTSEVCDMSFSCDCIINTFEYHSSYQQIVKQVDPALIDEAVHKSYTIGGEIIFPKYKINGKQTINGARGFNRKISDRFDLTLECIRLFYQGKDSPLFDCFNRYKDFFALFSSFEGYVDFFLLNDLFNEDGSIRFFHPFQEFGRDVRPLTVEQYMRFCERNIEFVNLRNARIDKVYNHLQA